MLLINLTSTLASINPYISTFYREDEPNTMDLTIIHVVDKPNNGIILFTKGCNDNRITVEQIRRVFVDN